MDQIHPAFSKISFMHHCTDLRAATACSTIKQFHIKAVTYPHISGNIRGIFDGAEALLQ